MLAGKATDTQGRHIVSYSRNYRRTSQRTPVRSDALVTPKQAAALNKMAAANGFPNGSALLADVASCTVTELGQKSRPTVQMFVDQAFARYGRSAQARTPRGRCEDAPCCGCCD